VRREVYYFSRHKGAEEGLTPYPNNDQQQSQVLRYLYFPSFPVSEVKRPHRPLVFEKSPDYIRSSSAITTIRSLLPGIKLVGIFIRSVRAQLHHHHLLHAGIGSEALFLQFIIRSSHQPIVMLWWWRSTLRQALETVMHNGFYEKQLLVLIQTSISYSFGSSDVLLLLLEDMWR